ncbi:hypothetical protein G9A89_002927 [Geosiphon pyriformis]|nr:hypothetical protein G9A89_002927 [Geosiphon pyriformis]
MKNQKINKSITSACCVGQKLQPTKFLAKVYRTTVARLRKKSEPNGKNNTKQTTSNLQKGTWPTGNDFDPLILPNSTRCFTSTEKDSMKSSIHTNHTKSSSTSLSFSSLRISRHTSHALPPLDSFQLFYFGYPKQSLILEAARILARIERGENVSESEKRLVRKKLEAEILNRCSLGTAEFLSWQAFLDMWKRIPE